MAAVQTLWQVVLAAALVGAGIVAFSLVWDATLQELVPGEALGRVTSIDMLGSFALQPLGYPLTGLGRVGKMVRVSA